MQSVLQKLGLTDDNTGVFDGEWRGGGAKIDKISPIDGQKLASVRTASADEYDGAMGLAGRGWGDHRFQFSSRGLVVERSPGRRLRRRDSLESFGKNAAYCDCSDKNCRARLSRDRRGSGDFYFTHGRPQDGRPKID